MRLSWKRPGAVERSVMFGANTNETDDYSYGSHSTINSSDKVSNHLNGNYASEWQTLVLQVSSSGIYYYVNGVLLTEHKALKYLPETDQFIYFNIWFDQLDRTKTTSRTYHQDADWVYFAEDALLLPSEVTARIAGFRASSTTRKDTVNDRSR